LQKLVFQSKIVFIIKIYFKFFFVLVKLLFINQNDSNRNSKKLFKLLKLLEIKLNHTFKTKCKLTNRGHDASGDRFRPPPPHCYVSESRARLGEGQAPTHFSWNPDGDFVLSRETWPLKFFDPTGFHLKVNLQFFFFSSYGLVGHRTASNAGDYAKPLLVVYYNVDYTRDAKGTNYVRNRILKVAKKLADENVNVRFAVSNAEEFRQELGQFGVSDVKKDEKYVVGRGSKDEKYRLTEDFSFEALENFARKLANGELEPYLKSQAVPEQTEDVKVVVAKNFDEIVNDESKDVLIEFYAPWCGHW
jgi:hypothetical protein